MTPGEPAGKSERYLDGLPPIDWSDREAAASVTADLLLHLDQDRSALRDLVHSIPQRGLLSMCESDEFRFKMVLYDAPDRGFRVRLHAWRSDFADTPHQHRFSYAARLLSGSYEHVIYDAGQPLTPDWVSSCYDQHLPLTDERVAASIDVTRFQRILSFEAVAGRTYYQDSSVDLSSTTIRGDTVSIFVRGPAVRDSSFQWHRDQATVVWRAGVAHSPATHRATVAASPQEFETESRRLETLGIFSMPPD